MLKLRDSTQKQRIPIQNPKQAIRIMVAPLDWGLGHASRCIPLIDALLAQGVEVVIGSSGQALGLLTQHYPALEAVALPAYQLRYSAGSSQIRAMARQLPDLWGSMRKEHLWLATYLKNHHLDALISDHRLGLWHRQLPSILIAHQIAIQPPGGMAWMRHLLFRAHWRYVNRFDEIWVPDAPGPNELVGAMVPEQIRSLDKVRFIGPLSHLKTHTDKASGDFPENIPILVILSGLEPQRTLLEQEICTQLKKRSEEVVLVQGLPENTGRRRKGNISFVGFLPSAELAGLCRRAEIVISRSGYSSLMDYAALGKQQLILIPTPGQTEQIYLAKRLEEQKIALIQSQESLNLQQGLEQIGDFRGFRGVNTTSLLLQEALNGLFHRILSINS